MFLKVATLPEKKTNLTVFCIGGEEDCIRAHCNLEASSALVQDRFKHTKNARRSVVQKQISVAKDGPKRQIGNIFNSFAHYKDVDYHCENWKYTDCEEGDHCAVWEWHVYTTASVSPLPVRARDAIIVYRPMLGGFPH